MSPTIICKRFFVSGTVQGVWYRASTVKKACELSLTGWVKNLDDGRVELIACGDEAALQSLENWLWQGPSAARVTDVEIMVCAIESFADFTQR